MMRERHAIITGTAHAIPSRLVTNDELATVLGEDIHPFVEGTLGINQRYWCTENESTATLAAEAGRRALMAAGRTPLDVDLVIVSTDTPEFISPPTASVVHGLLGTRRAGTFDLNAGCAGFVTALDTAWKFIKADDRYTCILVVGAYAMSKYLDLHDKKTVTIFADGAGAVVVELGRCPGVLASELFADGALCHGMGVFAGGTRTPITQAVLDSGVQNHLRFVQKYPASVNEEGWPRIVRSVLARIGKTERDVDHWLWTQVNRSTIVTVMGLLGEPMTKAHTIMGQWGYTGSACLPMALDDAHSKGLLKDGDLIVFTGSGAGLAMGCVAMTWRSAR
jgi:3-oxoacyl-[acyl-carrier-protein] synthase-3